MRKVRTRFAPSPTGFVHVGNLYGAYLSYAFARVNRGKFILRIEDTDQSREVEGAIEAVYKALKWVEIEVDEGPRQGGPYAPYIQSQRLDLYQKYAQELIDKGKAYYCFCPPERLEKVRQEQKKAGKPPMYNQHCRGLSIEDSKKRVKNGEKAVIRMKIPENQTIVVEDLVRGRIKFDSNLIDDQILLKANGFPTYHLAVVVDDHLMQISHVVRGEEWLPSFPKHKLLYQYLGWEMPQFFHNPLFRNPDGSKMSKRQGDVTVSWYRDQGFLPEALKNYMSLMGWSHPDEKEIFSEKEFIKHFDLKDVDPVSPVFDIEKLEWMNGVYIRNKSNKELAKDLIPYLPELSEGEIKQAVPLIKDRIKRLSEAKELLEFVWACPPFKPNTLMPKNLEKDKAIKMLKAARKLIEEIGIDNVDKLQKKIKEEIKNNGWKTGDFFMVLRVAVCAKKITPPILPALKLIGKEEALQRLDLAIKKSARP
jgi:glutamyl-tRNA synthetase